MSFLLYDYLNSAGQNEFQVWTETLQTKERAKLNQKLDMLEKSGDALFPHVLTGTPTPGVLKLRVKGSVQLRPLLCRGPLPSESAFTLLAGAKEVGSQLRPPGIDALAGQRKAEIIANPQRRDNHVRITK